MYLINSKTQIKNPKILAGKTNFLGFWSEISNQKKFAEWLEKELKIKHKEDWYNVTINDINKLGGRRLIDHHNGSIRTMLKTVFPEFPWDETKFRLPRGRKKMLGVFLRLIERILNI